MERAAAVLGDVPGSVPAMRCAPPPSIEPVMVVSPSPLMVRVLMMVCTSPPMVSDFPLATVQVCGAPMVTGALIVTLSLAVMPPAVTVSEPPLSR